MIEAHGDFIFVLARRLVPDSRDLDEPGKQRVLAIIAGALAPHPPKVARQLGLFLTLIRWLPALRYGGPLDRLAPETQDAALRWFQEGPVKLFRQGFWGVKALLYMGYYGRPEIHASLGYRPSTSGNERLHA